MGPGLQEMTSGQRIFRGASLFFHPGPVTDWPSASAGDAERFARFFHGMLDEGIYLAPSPYEALFLSAAHTEHDVDRTLEAMEQVLGRVFAGVEA